ncbi:MAG: TonB family protein [Nitrospira sp.]|nr:TonB family protein [Nitrospira sp.]
MGFGPSIAQKTARLGWGVSGFLHGIILAAAAVSVQVMTPQAVPQRELFRWEVSLSAAPRSEAVVSNGLQRATDASASEARLPEALDVPSLERTAASPLRLDEERQYPTASAEHSAPPLFPSSRSRSVQNHSHQRTAVMDVARPAESLVPPPEIESRRESNHVEVETRPEHVTVLQRPQAVTHALVNRTILPDYGWLRETLRSRLEEVKRYPAGARAVHAQGLVVVQVRVDGDGCLRDPEVKESSGSALLDRAAMAAVQAASPLALRHRLEGAPLVMLVPLSYRLE